jgi:ADP-heptose:LPS heptosyltransferase
MRGCISSQHFFDRERTLRVMLRAATDTPDRILMVKGHSAGVGDLLCSSAAWRCLRNRFPSASLHLWFLTRDPGAPSEQLIGRHPLLESFHVSDRRTRGRTDWRKLWAEARRVAEVVRPDLIIDFEPNGFRSSLLCWRMGRWGEAVTVGISQVPVRGWLYTRRACSTRAYARRHGLSLPLEYTERDFVALAALGIERKGTPVELAEIEEGRRFRQWLRAETGGKDGPPLLGLNIGCGTPDAVDKRPPLDLLAALVGELQRRHGFTLVLTGAPFEREINRQFVSEFRPSEPVMDLAGRTSLLELTGAIAACRLFISSDSGPYHMGVALRIPTLALFRTPNPVHYHHHAWVECRVAPGRGSLPDLLEAAERLLSVGTPEYGRAD